MRSLTAVALVLFIVLTIAAFPAAAQATPTNTAVYHVRQGDTLWRISRRYNTTPERLAALNAITAEAILRIGQPLRIPILLAPARPVAVAPASVVQSPPSPATTGPATTGPAAPAPAVLDQDPATVQELLTPETGPPAAPITPPAPAPNPSIASPQRPRIAPLPSRGAQWMSTIVTLSTRYLGAPYRWGGVSPSGFDCSGFINYIFERTGDVVFFQTVSPGPSHAGVYLGDDRFIHSSSGRGRVMITPMADSYYVSRYLGARRF